MGRSSPFLPALLVSLDNTIRAGIAVQYVLDAHLLGLVIRCVAQLQFLNPKTHHPSKALGFHVAACALLHALTILYHLIIPLEHLPRGIIIDFVGQAYLPQRLHMLFIDLGLACIQAIMLVLAYEHAHYGEDADLIDSHQEADSDVAEDPHGSPPASAHLDGTRGAHSPIASSSSSTFDTKFYNSEREVAKSIPIVDLRWRATVYRVMHDKPIYVRPNASANGNDDSDAEGRPAMTISPAMVSRVVRARIHRRRRELGLDGSAGAAEAEERLDEQSDEEREVGRLPDRPD